MGKKEDEEEKKGGEGESSFKKWTANLMWLI